MNKLTNEEIAKVFLMYYNAEIINPRFKGTPLQYKNSMSRWFEASKYEQTKEEFWAERKLVLTPLFAITDEHAIEVTKCCGFNNISWSDKRKRSIGKEIVYAISDNVSISYEVYAFEITYVFQYLIQQGYAVPLFFGISHWANGKTAIELGIAESK